MTAPRVSPPKVFPAATRAARPPMGAEGAADAHRQTGFVLGGDLELVLRGLELESSIVTASAGAKFRSQAMVAVVSQWSRSWLTRLQALHAAEWGNYAAALPLVRAATDYTAAALAMLRDPSEWNEWMEAGAVQPAHNEHATAFELHGFRSAETLAGHPGLGAIYRAASDLSMPHFGATLLVTAAESSADRTMVTFGDRDFHLALGEICLGWLVEMSAIHLEEVSRAEPDVLAGGNTEQQAAFVASADVATRRADRCRIERIERDGTSRWLIHNWRRTPGAAPKRILL